MTGHEAFAERQIRVAEDESLCREVNEQIEKGCVGSGHAGYTCECAEGCDAVVLLTIDEYEHVREFPTRFIVAPGHLVVGVEVLVCEYPGYHVVEKFGAGAVVASATDPRTAQRRATAA